MQINEVKMNILESELWEQSELLKVESELAAS